MTSFVRKMEDGRHTKVQSSGHLFW